MGMDLDSASRLLDSGYVNAAEQAVSSDVGFSYRQLTSSRYRAAAGPLRSSHAAVASQLSAFESFRQTKRGEYEQAGN